MNKQLFATLAAGLLASVAHAQLYSVYAPGASNPNAWFHDVTTGAFVDLNDPSADAFAADEETLRIYFLAENVPGPDGQLRYQQFDATGALVSTSSIGFPLTSDGRELSRAESLAFGNGTLYTHNRQIRDDAATGLYELSPVDATATFLFDPIFDGESIIIQGMAFNHDDGRLYAVARDRLGSSDESLYALDVETEVVERIVPNVGFADGVAYGDGRLYLVSNTGGAIRVYNLTTWQFEEPFANARRFEQGPGGATFAEFLRGPQTPEPRKVQIRSIDFDAGIIELFNFDRANVDLSGWRFCSHDTDDVRRYTAPSGFNGTVIESNSSFFVHFNNDSLADNPNRINRSDLGGSFATPLDPDAYGLQLFFPDENGNVSFGNSSLIADHLQWKLDNEQAGQSAFRTGQAVGEGLWSAADDFIITAPDASRIDLINLTGAIANEPSDYEVALLRTVCADANCDGVINTLDIDVFVTGLIDGQAAWEALVAANCNFSNLDTNGDGVVNTGDIDPFVAELLQGNGCP